MKLKIFCFSFIFFTHFCLSMQKPSEATEPIEPVSSVTQQGNADIATQRLIEIIESDTPESPEQIEEVKKLILQGANVNADNQDKLKVLLSSILKEKFNIAIILLQQGATPDLIVRMLEGENESAAQTYDYTLLLYVLKHQFREAQSFENLPLLVEALLIAGAPLNIPNEQGTAPIMVAALNHSEAIVQLLIDYGANVNTKNKGGNTALFYVLLSPKTAEKRLRTLKHLIEQGADINIVTAKNSTLLTLAIETLIQKIKNNPNTDIPAELKLIQFLLEHGADPNLGNGALWIFVTNIGHLVLLPMLLQAGANPNLPHIYPDQSLEPETPLQYAQEELTYTENEADKIYWQNVTDLLKNPKAITRTGLIKLDPTIQPAKTKSPLEEQPLELEFERKKTSEEYKKSAQEAAEKYLKQLKETKQ